MMVGDFQGSFNVPSATASSALKIKETYDNNIEYFDSQ